MDAGGLVLDTRRMGNRGNESGGRVAGGRGYTLIELSVVVLLAGMMLFLAVPRIRDSMLSDGLKTVTRRLVGASREIRTEAVREQVDYLLHLDLAHPGFWVYSADTTSEKLSEIRRKAFTFPDGVTIAGFQRSGQERQTDGDAEIRFYRQGYVDPVVLHLKKDDRFFTVVFHPFMNKVSVYEKNVDFSFDEEAGVFGR
jgi:general secretion pathway protein H